MNKYAALLAEFNELTFIGNMGQEALFKGEDLQPDHIIKVTEWIESEYKGNRSKEFFLADVFNIHREKESWQDSSVEDASYASFQRILRLPSLLRLNRTPDLKQLVADCEHFLEHAKRIISEAETALTKASDEMITPEKQEEVKARTRDMMGAPTYTADEDLDPATHGFFYSLNQYFHSATPQAALEKYSVSLGDAAFLTALSNFGKKVAIELAEITPGYPPR